MTGSTATVFEIEVPEQRTEVASVPFKVNGEPFTMRQPKLTAAVALIGMIDTDTDQPRINSLAAGAQVTQALWDLLGYVQKEPPEPLMLGDDTPGNPVRANPNAGRARGQARLIQRLRNPEDELDIVHLGTLFEQVVKATFEERPTGPLPASSESAASGGTDSEAATSEPAAATPTT